MKKIIKTEPAKPSMRARVLAIHALLRSPVVLSMITNIESTIGDAYPRVVIESDGRAGVQVNSHTPISPSCALFFGLRYLEAASEAMQHNVGRAWKGSKR